MTATQKKACEMMDRHNLGAIVTKFGYTWKETCRKNEAAADEVVRILRKKEQSECFGRKIAMMCP